MNYVKVSLALLTMHTGPNITQWFDRYIDRKQGVENNRGAISPKPVLPGAIKSDCNLPQTLRQQIILFEEHWANDVKKMGKSVSKSVLQS